MTDSSLFHRHELILRPDPSRTVIRPFEPDYPAGFDGQPHGRVRAIVGRVLALTDAQLKYDVDMMMAAFGNRHRDIDTIVLRRFVEIADQLANPGDIDGDRRLLIGPISATNMRSRPQRCSIPASSCSTTSRTTAPFVSSCRSGASARGTFPRSRSGPGAGRPAAR